MALAYAVFLTVVDIGIKNKTGYVTPGVSSYINEKDGSHYIEYNGIKYKRTGGAKLYECSVDWKSGPFAKLRGSELYKLKYDSKNDYIYQADFRDSSIYSKTATEIPESGKVTGFYITSANRENQYITETAAVSAICSLGNIPVENCVIEKRSYRENRYSGYNIAYCYEGCLIGIKTLAKIAQTPDGRWLYINGYDNVSDSFHGKFIHDNDLIKNLKKITKK